ncbi:glycoside hydrolase family 97 protein [Zobellia galactanivorans]|uniref:Alpha-glucosidase, family GH97 n=1 Tax=Zobellia galactanivorans (strain DSM 12802 / CCUG 47099 / CIP 106680 / NCIMB 13871 / Dsij) TaxID=63186 RepID=G0LC21_ZOBGA|nr:glycoside hydrolase family 97 protein [Zobellia galactanivorans]CAZ96581.1 Alpha-glucosidase, family GH97 [Zobellia galactanivorans]
MKNKKWLIIGWIFFVASLSKACKVPSHTYILKSPDQSIELTLAHTDGILSYSIFQNGQQTLENSALSIFPNTKVKVTDTKITSFSNTWSPVWGQFSKIQDTYNELEVSLDYEGVPATLYIRAYDGGSAFRFMTDKYPIAKKPAFYMEYGLSASDKIYMPAGESMPIGPIVLSDLERMDSIPYRWKVPLVIETDQSKYISLLESDLVSAPGFSVIDFEYDKKKGKLISNNEFTSEGSKLTTPWRLVLIEENIGDLLTNTIPQNVAAPLALEDTSWIKPGKTVWDWRVHGYTAADGFTYGIDTESYLRFIDFAAENGIEYFMIDDAWYTDVSKGQIEMSDKLDLQKVMDYAKEKGVSVLLYYDRRQGDYGDAALFPYYQELGAKGIKYGFMGSNVSFTREAIKKSAESELLIDFHDSPVPFTGVTRTYPNAITREYCHAQQDSRRAFTPQAFIRMALINALQGPLDMNNGVFDITGVNTGEREKGPKAKNLNTTVTAEAARTLIIFSGLVCIPDAPEAYTEKSDLFEFIKEMPIGQWDETKILHAKMDAYISTARRHNASWFIGSVYNEPGGELPIVLDFLEAGKAYDITYYEDTDATHFKTKPEAYQVRRGSVKKGDVINAKIAPGGGHCMWIRPSKK